MRNGQTLDRADIRDDLVSIQHYWGLRFEEMLFSTASEDGQSLGVGDPLYQAGEFSSTRPGLQGDSSTIL
jgi:hypothetical protein